MNWGALWAGVGAAFIGLLTNELSDIAPSLARKVLRMAARWEAADPVEAEECFAELCEFLEDVNGRVTKLVWAIGRLRYGASMLARRRAQKRNLTTAIIRFVDNIFRFFPRIILRLSVMLYPKDDPRREEILAELHRLTTAEQYVWAVQQVETAFFDGLRKRAQSRRR